MGAGSLRPCYWAPRLSTWADAIGRTLREDTMITRCFSGRPARSIACLHLTLLGASHVVDTTRVLLQMLVGRRHGSHGRLHCGGGASQRRDV